jgi:predicted phosphodiesterase
MNDANYIFDGYPIVMGYGRSENILDTQKYYRDQKALLKDIRCDILFTHIAQIMPPRSVIKPLYQDSEDNIFYYVDNFDLVHETGCSHYIYGHVHDDYDFKAGDISVHVNPIGYPSESFGKEIKSFEYKKEQEK